jgi:hypothetical protein
MSSGNVETIDFNAIEGKSSSSNSNKKKTPGDFPSLFADLFMSIDWKMALFLVVIWIILSSDVFIDKVLRKFKGSVENMTPTNKGTVIQALFGALFYIILDGIMSAGLI